MTVTAAALKSVTPSGTFVGRVQAGIPSRPSEPTQTLMIPQSALQVDQSGSYVLVVGADNKVEQRRLKLGPVQGADITVTDGLKPGELVIVEGIQKVRPGEAVTATPTVQSSP